MWNKMEDGLPIHEGEYLCCYMIYGIREIDIQRFTLDAFSISHYDFEEYKGCKKAMFYSHDNEYGYHDTTKYITHWMEIPELPED